MCPSVRFSIPEMRVFTFYFVIAALAATSMSVKGQGYQPSREELDAIRKVETGGCTDPLNAVGDGGISIGPYQIMLSYHTDAREFDPSLPPYESMRGPNSIANSELVMQAFSNRYTTEVRLGRPPTFEDYARNHNGGPNGYKLNRTVSYYANVLRNLPLRSKRGAVNGTEEFMGCPLGSGATYPLAVQSFVIALGLLALAVIV